MPRIPTEDDEDVRRASLVDAQRRAEELFAAVDEAGIIRPGTTDEDASRAVTDLAAERFGVERHWHKRIVRSGPNTLLPYQENPPDRTIDDDDIAFADFGPIFDGWEADFGRTWSATTPTSCGCATTSIGSGPMAVASSTSAPTSPARSSTPRSPATPPSWAGASATTTAATWWASSRTRTSPALGPPPT